MALIRFLFRVAATFSLAIAVIMAVIDATRSIAADRIVLTPLAEYWRALAPETLEALREKIRKELPALFNLYRADAYLLRKIVASNQQLEFTWRNSEQLHGGLVETVRALKNDPSSGHIALSGSVSVVRQLLAARLVDELHLFVHPIVVGKGLRLFDKKPMPSWGSDLSAIER